MPDTPSLIFGDTNVGGHGFGDGGTQNAGMASSTNDAMPRFGGRANPGERIFLKVGDRTMHTDADENGMWDIATPELDDGDHDFKMWSEDGAGNASEAMEWETSVQANAEDRASQRYRNQQWRESGRDEWRDQNAGLTPTPVSAGSGGTATAAGGGTGTGAGPDDAESGEHPPTPVLFFEKGNSPGG